MNNKRAKAIVYAVLAAALYAISAPVSKLLLSDLSATLLSALLYLGAGAGMCAVGLFTKNSAFRGERLRRGDTKYVIAMIALDIAAPILLMLGLTRTTAANASLLNNFEIVATSLIALLLFRERISVRLWAAIALVTAASVLLSLSGGASGSLHFSTGSVLILGATVCWGFENNCTRALSNRDPVEVVIVKGFGSGTGAFIIAAVSGGVHGTVLYILLALLLGFVAYGLSIFFYVLSQRDLGAARTSAYYAVAPFIGAGISLVIFNELPSTMFLIALGVMGAGAFLAASDGRKEGEKA